MLCLGVPLGADVRGCACDAAKPETLEARECALCREAEAQPSEPPVFFLKDNNPRKPNRLLVLPRAHGKGPNSLAGMTPEQRLLLWSAAIAKARPALPKVEPGKGSRISPRACWASSISPFSSGSMGAGSRPTPSPRISEAAATADRE